MTDDLTPPPPSGVDVDPPPTRGRRLRVILLALVLALAAEAGVRAIEPSLPTPAGWPDVAVATKVAQLDALASNGCADVVFVGNSMTRDDLVPAVFTDADDSGRSAYNASLDAASPLLLERWVAEEVLPTARPATVVIGVASIDVNDEATTPHAALRSYVDAPYTAPGLTGEVESEFTRALALVRNRTSLRDPTTVARGIADRVAGRRADRPSAAGIPGVLAADGHGLSRRDLQYTGDAATGRRLQSQFLDPFDIGGRQIDALERLIVDIQRSGAAAVLLVLPVTDDYVDAHPGGSDDVASFRSVLDTVAERHDATVIDAPPAMDGDFADTHHLNGDGADRLSASLPALLAEAGVDDRPCGPS